MMRPLYRRTMDLTVVKSFRLDAATMLHPGDKLPAHVRMFHKRGLYRRRIVGAANDPWTLSQIPAAVVLPPTQPLVIEPDAEVEPEAPGENPAVEGETEAE